MRLVFWLVLLPLFAVAGAAAGALYGDELRFRARMALAGEEPPAIATTCAPPAGVEPGAPRTRLFVVRRGGEWAVRIARLDPPLDTYRYRKDALEVADRLARLSCPSLLTIQCSEGRRWCEGRAYSPAPEAAGSPPIPP